MVARPLPRRVSGSVTRAWATNRVHTLPLWTRFAGPRFMIDGTKGEGLYRRMIEPFHPLAIHPLDRPVWTALTGRQAGLAQGDARALRFAPDYGLFAAAADTEPENLAALAALIPPDSGVALVERELPPCRRAAAS